MFRVGYRIKSWTILKIIAFSFDCVAVKSGHSFSVLKILSGCILYLEHSNAVKRNCKKKNHFFQCPHCSFRACENFIVLLNRQKLLDVNELILRGSGGPLFIFGWFFFSCSFTVYFGVLPCNPVINFLKPFSWLGLNYHSMERGREREKERLSIVLFLTSRCQPPQTVNCLLLTLWSKIGCLGLWQLGWSPASLWPWWIKIWSDGSFASFVLTSLFRPRHLLKSVYS